jgi:DNA repair photolyase
MAKKNLVHVMISITTLREDLRLLMEPRTVTAQQRLNVVNKLSNAGIPTGVMTAPVIPGLTSDEIPDLVKAAAENGAMAVGYTMLRLNGSVKELFHDWLYKCFPDAADKVWHQVQDVHGGQVNDSRFGKRMRGEGKIAESVNQLFKLSVKKFLEGRKFPEFDYKNFRRPGLVQQLKIDF